MKIDMGESEMDLNEMLPKDPDGWINLIRTATRLAFLACRGYRHIRTYLTVKRAERRVEVTAESTERPDAAPAEPAQGAAEQPKQ